MTHNTRNDWEGRFDAQYTSMAYGEKWRPGMEFTPSMIKAFTHQELQKAREEERAFILQELALRDLPDEDGGYPLYTARQISDFLKSEWRIKPDQSELDQATDCTCDGFDTCYKHSEELDQPNK